LEKRRRKSPLFSLDLPRLERTRAIGNEVLKMIPTTTTTTTDDANVRKRKKERRRKRKRKRKRKSAKIGKRRRERRSAVDEMRVHRVAAAAIAIAIVKF
jgi:hypothetical protein